MREIAKSVAQGLQCCIRFETTYGGPPVVNDPALTERAAAALTRAVGTAHVQKIAPIMPSEDFAWYRTRVPGAMLLLGVGEAKRERTTRSTTANSIPMMTRCWSVRQPLPQRRVIFWRRKRSRFVQNPTCAFAESMI